MDRKKWKNEWMYFWADYKWILLAGLLIAALGIHFLVTALTRKETVLCVMLIDCHAFASQEEMNRDYMEAVGLDPASCQTEILSTLLFSDAESGTYAMTSLSRFMADIGNGKLDAAGMLEDDFIKYDKSGTWMNLAELPGWEELSGLVGNSLLTEGSRVIGIYADALPGVKRYGCYESPEKRGVVGILYNAPHVQEAGRYLKTLAAPERKE